MDPWGQGVFAYALAARWAPYLAEELDQVEDQGYLEEFDKQLRPYLQQFDLV